MKRFISIVTMILLTFSVPIHAAENLARQIVEAEASTYYSDDYLPSNVYDGIVWDHDLRLPSWITDYELEADLTLAWKNDVTISKVMMYDLASTTENVVSGTLTFSDGTKVDFGPLNPDGTATEIPLPKTVTANSAVIHVVADEDTMSVGLDEVEMLNEAGENLALQAEASASSTQPDGAPYWYIPEAYTGWHVAQKAINGVATVTRPAGAECEWASKEEPLPWIKLSWTSPIVIGTIVLRDRVGDADHITGGEITFGDGTMIPFASLENNGELYYIDVPDIKTDTFTIQVTSSEGPNPGLAEVEVYTEHFDASGNPVGGTAEIAAGEITASEPAVDSVPAAVSAVSQAPETSDFATLLIGFGAVGFVFMAVLVRKVKNGEKL